MSIEFLSANGARAMRVARKIVKPIDWGDVESLVTQSMPYSEMEELFSSVSSDYCEHEELLDQLRKAIQALTNDETDKLIGEYVDLHFSQELTKLQGWFQLGFAAAVQLLGTPPPMEVVNGGIAARLKGSSSL